MREKTFDFYNPTRNTTVIGGPYAYVYWVIGEEALLIDAGTIIWGRKLKEAIPLYLDYAEFRYHFLTHSHYDHLGGTPEIVEAFRDIKIGAHPKVKKVLKSERAIELITRLNREEMKLWGRGEKAIENYRFKPFRIHIELREGMRFDLGDGVEIEVLETPGHTRDSISFIIHPDGIAVVGEACGVPNGEGDYILPQFLADYDLYIESLKKIMERRDIKILGLPHERIVEGEENVREYLERSYKLTLEYAEDIERVLRKHGGDFKKVEEELFELYYIGRGIRQPEHAYRANLRAQIAAIAKKMGMEITRLY